MVPQQIFGVDAAFGLVGRLPSHRPREALRVPKLRGAGGDEQLRDLLRVHVFLDCGIGRRAEALEDQQHLVALHQLARLLNRFRRAEAVVVGNEIDLAAVDAAFGIDLGEIGRLGLADQAVGGQRPAVGHDVAELDFDVARTRIVFLLRDGWIGKRCRSSENHRCKQKTPGCHVPLLNGCEDAMRGRRARALDRNGRVLRTSSGTLLHPPALGHFGPRLARAFP